LGIHSLRKQVAPTLKFLATTEVHTYAFSVAANAILSFFPAMVMFLTLSRKLLHSTAMSDAVLKLARDFLPSNQKFITDQITLLATQRKVQIFSLFMLLVSSTGVFEPLEVALNKIWDIRQNRSYLRNQLVSLGVAVGCSACFLISAAAQARSGRMIQSLAPTAQAHPIVAQVLNFLLEVLLDWTLLKLLALAAMISMFFLIYWALPNGKVPARSVLPAAVVVGVLYEVSKYVYMALLPLLNFHEVYGPFYVSVTLIFWAFWVGMLLLGGAHLSAAEHLAARQAQRQAQVAVSSGNPSATADSVSG
jgi:YihY family inner membrane protein